MWNPGPSRSIIWSYSSFLITSCNATRSGRSARKPSMSTDRRSAHAPLRPHRFSETTRTLPGRGPVLGKGFVDMMLSFHPIQDTDSDGGMASSSSFNVHDSDYRGIRFAGRSKQFDHPALIIWAPAPFVLKPNKTIIKP